MINIDRTNIDENTITVINNKKELTEMMKTDLFKSFKDKIAAIGLDITFRPNISASEKYYPWDVRSVKTGQFKDIVKIRAKQAEEKAKYESELPVLASEKASTSFIDSIGIAFLAKVDKDKTASSTMLIKAETETETIMLMSDCVKALNGVVYTCYNDTIAELVQRAIILNITTPVINMFKLAKVSGVFNASDEMAMRVFDLSTVWSLNKVSRGDNMSVLMDLLQLAITPIVYTKVPEEPVNEEDEVDIDDNIYHLIDLGKKEILELTEDDFLLYSYHKLTIMSYLYNRLF